MKKFIGLVLAMVSMSCQSKSTRIEVMEKEIGDEIATFAGGCFWCTEAVFLEIDGVKSVVSGYTGGKTINPTYKEICTGETGHAEAIQIVFDPRKVTFGELLEIFFATHDPTTINRQGNDVGTQYRSEVFYHDENQKELTEAYIALLNDENTFGKKIVTKLSLAPLFYPAEEYHKNYYGQNQTQSYCTYIITPKIEKVRTKFKNKLKKKA